MADAGTKNFGSILSAGLYRIPDYQRGYAWTSEEVNDLLDDLEYVTDNDAVNDHYLNSIIVADAEEKTLTDVSHVIDGQQRLLTSVLLANEILRKGFELGGGGNGDTDHLKRQVEEKLYTDIFKRSASSTRHRALPAEEHQDIFKQLVTEDLESDRDVDDLIESAESPSEQKLAEAVSTISSRIDSLLEAGERESKDERLLYLDRLASTLHSDFTATLHEVESPSEAGRIFEAINDRGRNLNRADKIKSYLVYRATLGDVDVDVTEVHETFTKVYEILNEYASTPSKVDSLVDRLVGQHWNMFAGENQITNSDYLAGRHEEASEDIAQIKHAKYHVSKESDDTRVQKWMEVYLESLENAAEAYVQVRGQDQDKIYRQLIERLPSEADENQVRHRLYAIERFGRSTLHSLSMALYLRFSDSESYESVLFSIEKFVMRVFGIGGARRDNKRNDFESLSTVLFWKARDDIEEVFPADSPIPQSVENNASSYDILGGDEDGEAVAKRLEKWAYGYSHETEDGVDIDDFQRRLEEDNLEGLGVAGWGGISPNELKNYMLYRYEEQIRDGGVGLPSYLGRGIYDFTVEHVWPGKRGDHDIAPELDDNEYARYVDRLGNLAFLTLSENATAGNDRYNDKWDSTYSAVADGTKMVREEFPDPTGENPTNANEAGHNEWGTPVIEWRSEKMAEVLAEYWMCDT